MTSCVIVLENVEGAIASTAHKLSVHYDDVIMVAIASQITSLTVVSSIVYSDTDQRKHQSSVSLAFVPGIHRGPVNSPHKWPVTRKNVSIWWRHHAMGEYGIVPIGNYTDISYVVFLNTATWFSLQRLNWIYRRETVSNVERNYLFV